MQRKSDAKANGFDNAGTGNGVVDERADLAGRGKSDESVQVPGSPLVCSHAISRWG